MKTRNDLIYSNWATDEVDFYQRAFEVLQTVSKLFPKVTYWKAGNRFDRGLEDTLEFDVPSADDMSSVEGFDAIELWRQTTEHFINLGLDSKDTLIQMSLWSDELEKAVAVYLNESSFDLDDWDSEWEEERTLPTTDVYERLTKTLGTLSNVNGIWMLNHSRFAGNPVWLYEPEYPFDDYYNIDGEKQTQARNRIREIRKQVEAVFSSTELINILQELGAEVESIGQDKVFVKFGNLGSNVGKTVHFQFNRQVSERLEKSSFQTGL